MKQVRSNSNVLAWNLAGDLPRRVITPGWRPGCEPFDVCAALSVLCADVCRRVEAFRHIDISQVLISFVRARNGRCHGLQARLTPLRFPGGKHTRVVRSRPYQVQRYVVGGVEMLYLMSFCLPRFLDRDFDDKFVTIFHELYHIGPRFDGDLRRHGGRCAFHSDSKKRYDAYMAWLARQYLAGANPSLHEFLKSNYRQLVARHGAVVGVQVPRPKILPVLLEYSLACRVS